MSSSKKAAEGKEEKVQLIVVPEGHSLEGYIHLENTDGSTASLPDNGVLITENALPYAGPRHRGCALYPG